MDGKVRFVEFYVVNDYSQVSYGYEAKQSKRSLDEGTGFHALQITLHTVRYERDRVTPALRELYWLTVAERIQYKLCLLVHKSLLGHTLEYISDLLTSVANIPGRSTLERAIDGAETAAIDGLVLL